MQFDMHMFLVLLLNCIIEQLFQIIMELLALSAELHLFRTAFGAFDMRIILCKECAVIHILLLSPPDKNPVHRVRCPVVHRDLGHL